MKTLAKINRSSNVLLAAKTLAALALLSWVVLLGRQMRDAPSHCPTGFVSFGVRCCAPGQTLSPEGSCAGEPTSCPPPTLKVSIPTGGCVRSNRRVRIAGGTLTVGPTDWDASNVRERSSAAVLPFLIDSLEVNAERYAECMEAGVCTEKPPSQEPGLPVTSISAKQAGRFCAFAGGHLPTTLEWTFAAMGATGRRYPWGAHGLVCRRAVYGLVDGPCGEGARTPELGGVRPDGATSEGLFDLSGNVSEWTLNEQGLPEVKGGSFRSKLAADLKSVGRAAPEPADDVGFRCAYPIAGIGEALSSQKQPSTTLPQRSN